MPENPYEPPKDEGQPQDGEYAYPYRVYEWIAIVVLLALAVALLLPVVRPR
jgi:hypothetical protein